MTREELDQMMPPMGEAYLYMKTSEGNAHYIWVSQGQLNMRSVGLTGERLNVCTNTFSPECTDSIRQMLNNAAEGAKKSKK